MMSSTLLVWREDNIWVSEPDWRFRHPLEWLFSKAFSEPQGARRGSPKLLKNIDALSAFAGLSITSVPNRDRDAFRDMLDYLAAGGDLHTEWST
ncbi:MAG: hypothetical protein HOM58_13615 [Rhodospirillaceae bacterium]|jgi:hypothetical protein|nr:hypothetical protein [Rhodospirillaceae bacterium]MBT5457156.1 hypothetical protein [Rhodospirillaceae bacterium]